MNLIPAGRQQIEAMIESNMSNEVYNVILEGLTELAFSRPIYTIRHLDFFFFFAWSAARVAVSKTSLTPSLVFAEHSM